MATTAAKNQQRGSKAPKAQEAPQLKKYTRENPPRLKAMYHEQIRGKLKEELGLKSIMEVPSLVKITINMGLGAANANPKILDSAINELRLISGQSPVVTRARKDIATFKLRKGQKIGAMVTLRAERMWEFLDRLINIALPQVRDFKGISFRAFDGNGNYSLGVREQIVFPEISYDQIDSVKGMNVTIVTTATKDDQAKALLTHLGMPFRRPSTPVPGTTQAVRTTSQGAQA